MARRRKSGPRRKPGARTKSGRLSRAYKDPEIRDQGTKEFQAKRLALVNGADPALAATAPGILLANGFISPQQHAACQRYGWAHAMTFGRPWAQASPLAESAGSEPPARIQEIAKDRLEQMNRHLSKTERLRVANLAVFNFLPTWFFAKRGNWKRGIIPEDEREHQELLTALNAISDE